MQQSLFYQGTGQVLQSLHVQVRRRGDDAPTLLGELVSMELCSQREIRISVLPGVHKPEQFHSRGTGAPDPGGGCVCLLGTVSVVPLCRGSRLTVFSPTALQTQLCSGRFNTYLMRTMCVHTYGCVYICLHMHTI